jgi:hypothetical protein
MSKRPDSIGFFWEDIAKVKAPPKEVVHCVPPERTWEAPGYLPGLDEARAYQFNFYTDYELGQACTSGERLVWDIECYPNYFLIGFKGTVSGKIIYFEYAPDFDIYPDYSRLVYILNNFCLIDFNGRHYDAPIAALALAGFTPEQLWEATCRIIGLQEAPWMVLRSYKVKKLDLNHIDLKEIPPTEGSLKKYAGRLHCKRMQDLPFKPGTYLSLDQITITRWYWVNDLDNTELLYNFLKPNIELREKLMQSYNADLRSRSDAQIAEDILAEEMTKILGVKHIQKPKIDSGTIYRFNPPSYLQYRSPTMQYVLDLVRNCDFTLGDDNKISAPPQFEGFKVEIADSTYAMGIGGLHSCEKRAAHVSDANYILVDRDVASFYPSIILNLGLFPKHLGQAFLRIYRKIVTDRLGAKDGAKALEDQFGKRKGMPQHIVIRFDDLKMVAESLKVVINGSFGKLGSFFSILFSPDLMIAVTIGGQLSLLMMIERLALAGISVVSANTDGIVIKCHRSMMPTMNEIVAGWEADTGFKTEETHYIGLFSRDINNYIAVKTDGDVKVKGVYSERGSNGNTVLSKNATNLICADAVSLFLGRNIQIEETIRNSRDIRRFVTIRHVKGGAVKDGQYLGSMIRYYYSNNDTGNIIYAASGKKVPRSDGAKPCMTLPEEFPDDIKYDWYIEEAYKMLDHIGYTDLIAAMQ